MTGYEKNNDPLISIIMPVRNGGQFIGGSIRSVIAQTYENWELVIVNDHSSDATSDIVKEFIKSDKRIRLINLRGKRSGAACSRRCAINNSRGSWIAFLDSDDKWAPEKLRLQMDEAVKSGSRLIFTASMFMDETGRLKNFVFHVPERIAYPEILKQDVIPCSSVLVRKDLLYDSFYETDNFLCDDYAAWIRILRDNGETARGIDLPLLKYRISRTSLSYNKIKSSYRTYLTYRHVGLSVPAAVYYWCWYAVRSLKKYSGIYFE